mgnify:CR=1 FL=1
MKKFKIVLHGVTSIFCSGYYSTIPFWSGRALDLFGLFSRDRTLFVGIPVYLLKGAAFVALVGLAFFFGGFIKGSLKECLNWTRDFVAISS